MPVQVDGTGKQAVHSIGGEWEGSLRQKLIRRRKKGKGADETFEVRGTLRGAST